MLVSSELPNEVLADNIRTFELESTNVKATNIQNIVNINVVIKENSILSLVS